MKRIQKWTALVLALLLSWSSFTAAAGEAEEPSVVEEAIIFMGTDDGFCLYLRMAASIRGIADDFSLEVRPTKDSEWLPPVQREKIIVEPPCAENGERLELFAPIECEKISVSAQIRANGFVTADGTSVAYSGETSSGVNDPGALQMHYPGEEISSCINYYLCREDRDYIAYCVQGTDVQFETKWDQLKNHLSATWDGVQMRVRDSGAPIYTAVSGEGTITLHVMRHIHYTTKIRVVTEKERKSLLLHAAAQNPKMIMSACFQYTMAAGTLSLFPIGFLFMPIVLPFALLASPIGYAIELAHILLTGKSMLLGS